MTLSYPSLRSYLLGLRIISKLRRTSYNLKPSDAIHLAVIENNGLQAIVTEDREFERVPIRVIWVD